MLSIRFANHIQNGNDEDELTIQLVYYVSPSSGYAYKDRQLTPNF